MELLDARRLTGSNLLARAPLVIVEVALGAAEPLGVALEAYSRELSRMRAALGLSPEVALKSRIHRGGAVIGYEAPVDVMLACAEMSEWAALSVAEILAGRQALSLEPKQSEIGALIQRDRSPRLLALLAEAKRRALPLLWDDEHVSIGEGSRSACWPRAELPDVDEVPWQDLGAIPVALVTGTNGKTTSTRLLARMAREAGFHVGAASSDEISVGTQVVQSGDWTGPAAARIVLRDRGVDFAVLETARGGILRRGLAVESCDAALITNVSDDHLGSYGIDDLAAMTRVKAVVADAVRPAGTVVLNAHDEKLVALASSLDQAVVFFANLDRDDPAARAVIEGARACGAGTVSAEGGKILDGAEPVVDVAAVSLTFGGRAGYNVENVVACVAMARALGIGQDAIVRAITTFKPSDNPRRGELLERRGVRVLLDFGHNPDGIRGVLQLTEALRRDRPGRLVVVAGAAGDRSEHDIAEVASAIRAAQPHRVLLRDLGGYLRGRAPGEVPRMFQDALCGLGFPAEAVATVGSEVEALRSVFDAALPGDFVVVLVHLEQAAVHAFLDAQGE